MANLWTQPNNHLLRTLVERVTIGPGDLSLPLSTTQDVTVSLISGQLPIGMRINGTDIVGTPVEEVREVEYVFVLRATSLTHLEDRTFKLKVTGEDAPRWLTSPGFLPIGANGLLFILDNEIIDFSLTVIDPDLPAGDKLHFYIEPGDGVLPPGIKLTPDGRLQGVIEPLLALDKQASQGGYDTNRYDLYPNDYLIKSDSGYGSFFYDSVGFGYSLPTRTPRKLNRYYEFAVHVADSTSEPIRRKFRIYVVADEFLKADNTIMKVANGVFTADNINIRTPQWITPSDLGFIRADNYATIYLDTLESETLEGRVLYRQKERNPDGSQSTLPPGTQLSTLTGEITGVIPTQPAVTREYKFTVIATRFTTDTDFAVVTLQIYEDTLSGKNSFKIYKLPLGAKDGIDDLNDLRDRELIIRNKPFIVSSINSSNEDFDVITLSDVLLPDLQFTIRETVSTQVDQFYIDRLDYSQEQQWQNKQVIYSDNEVYTVERIHPYIEWEITSASGSIAVDYNAAGVDPPAGGNETLESAVTRIFSTEQLPVEVISATSNKIQFVAAVSKDTARSRLRAIFGSGTTDDLIYTIVNNNRSLVQLDKNLLPGRSFAKGDTIGLGLFEDDVIEKELITDANTDITNPSSEKTFTINVLGEVDSVITWLTPADLGTITANFTSTYSVAAKTTVPDGRLIYSLVDGRLPNGLRLSYRGEIIGEARQFATDNRKGLTRLDSNTTSDSTTFDEGSTTFDRVFNFTVKAEDRFGLSATTREFTLEVLDLDATLYSNLYLQPFMKQTLRDQYTRFVSDPEIFPPNDIYRPNDPAFGLRTSIRFLAYAGIESKAINEYVVAAAKNHKRRRYKLGDVKRAIAKRPGTNEIVYELVYVEVIDPADSKHGDTREQFIINNFRSSNYRGITTDTGSSNGSSLQNDITADSTGVVISTEGDIIRYLSNTTNMRKRIEDIGKTQRDYLPLWMRTGQDNSIQELGYVTAIPLAYCKEGRSKDVLLNVQNALQNGEFDFKQLDLDIDRYVIDGTLNVDDEKYILFANYRFNE